MENLLSDDERIDNMNKDILRKFYEVADQVPFNREKLAAFFSDDFTDHNRAEQDDNISDKENVLNFYQLLTECVENTFHEIKLLEETESDKVMLMWTYTGKHVKPLFGMPAKNNDILIDGIEIFTLADGKITDMWHVEELATLVAQIEA